MNFVTVKDFGEALGVNGVTVRQRIVRGKLIKNEYGLIDVTNPINYSYVVEVKGGDLSIFVPYYKSVDSLAKVIKKSTVQNKNAKNINLIINSAVVAKNEEIKEVNVGGGLVNSLHVVETKKTEPIKGGQKLSLEEKRIMLEQKKTNSLLVSFELRKKEAEVQLIERKAELTQYELEKKAGNTLPLDMIEKIIGINYKAVLKSCHAQSKNIAMVMVQQLGGSKEDLDSILIELESIFENVVKDSKRKASVDIDKMIDEYSEVRSRGERKA